MMSLEEQIEMWEDRYKDAVKDKEYAESENEKLKDLIEDIANLINKI